MLHKEKRKMTKVYLRCFDEFGKKLKCSSTGSVMRILIKGEKEVLTWEYFDIPGYVYSGYSYAIDSRTNFSGIIKDKTISIEVLKGTREVIIDQYYEEVANVHISNVSSKNKRVGGSVITSIRVKNSSNIHIYSAIVSLTVNGHSYEKNIDIAPMGNACTKFSWKAPEEPGAIDATVKVELSGYYEELQDNIEDNAKNFVINII